MARPKPKVNNNVPRIMVEFQKGVLPIIEMENVETLNYRMVTDAYKLMAKQLQVQHAEIRRARQIQENEDATD